MLDMLVTNNEGQLVRIEELDSFIKKVFPEVMPTDSGGMGSMLMLNYSLKNGGGFCSIYVECDHEKSSVTVSGVNEDLIFAKLATNSKYFWEKAPVKKFVANPDLQYSGGF